MEDLGGIIILSFFITFILWVITYIKVGDELDKTEDGSFFPMIGLGICVFGPIWFILSFVMCIIFGA